jgi:hypothetical protein
VSLSGLTIYDGPRWMASLGIRRIPQNRYAVREYGPVLSVSWGEMTNNQYSAMLRIKIW